MSKMNKKTQMKEINRKYQIKSNSIYYRKLKRNINDGKITLANMHCGQN